MLLNHVCMHARLHRAHVSAAFIRQDKFSGPAGKKTDCYEERGEPFVYCSGAVTYDSPRADQAGDTRHGVTGHWP